MRLRYLTGVLALVLLLVSGYAHLGAQANGILYAFANPLRVPAADHTWVTDYENFAQCAERGPRSKYWYATGKCHPVAGDRSRALANAPADLRLAQCIAKPDESTFTAGRATARIRYGIDGVCHQICNRILWATAVGGATPITVAGANGYGVSRLAYGTYGTPLQWRQLKQDCRVASSSIAAASARADAEQMIAEKLGPISMTSDKAQTILAEHSRLRGELDQLADRGLSRGQLANAANRAINDSLARLAEALDPADFQRLLDWPPNKEIVLVNPD